MLEFLPEDIRKGLLMAEERARRAPRRRLSVHVGNAVFPVLRVWDEGFAVDSARAPRLRGLVDLYDGPRHLSRCLIVAAAVEDGHTLYEYKGETVVFDHAPRDYAVEPDRQAVRLPAPF